jgi:hypothetical protein
LWDQTRVVLSGREKTLVCPLTIAVPDCLGCVPMRISG